MLEQQPDCGWTRKRRHLRGCHPFPQRLSKAFLHGVHTYSLDIAFDQYAQGPFVHDNLPGGLGYASSLSYTRITLRTTHRPPLPCLAMATFKPSGDGRLFCACHLHVEENPAYFPRYTERFFHAYFSQLFISPRFMACS